MNSTENNNSVVPVIFIYTFSSLAILLNTLVLLIAVKFVNFQTRLEQLFVFNMTVGDFIFSVLIIPAKFYIIDLPYWIHKSFAALLYTGSGGSVVFLLLLNFHKLITLYFPLHSMIFISKQKVIAQIIMSWIVLFIVSTLYCLKGYYVKEFGLGAAQPAIYASMTLVLFIIPLITSFLISSAIFLLAQKKARKQVGRGRIVFKRIIFVFTSTFWSIFTSLPIKVVVFIWQLCIILSKDHVCARNQITSCVNLTASIQIPMLLSEQTFEQNCIEKFINYINMLYPVLIFGSVLNPVITIVTQRMYINGVKRLCKPCGVLFSKLVC